MQEEDKRLPSAPSRWLVDCPSCKDQGYKLSNVVQFLRECFYSCCELYKRVFCVVGQELIVFSNTINLVGYHLPVLVVDMSQRCSQGFKLKTGPKRTQKENIPCDNHRNLEWGLPGIPFLSQRAFNTKILHFTTNCFKKLLNKFLH